MMKSIFLSLFVLFAYGRFPAWSVLVREIFFYTTNLVIDWCKIYLRQFPKQRDKFDAKLAEKW